MASYISVKDTIGQRKMRKGNKGNGENAGIMHESPAGVAVGMFGQHPGQYGQLSYTRR